MSYSSQVYTIFFFFWVQTRKVKISIDDRSINITSFLNFFAESVLLLLGLMLLKHVANLRNLCCTSGLYSPTRKTIEFSHIASLYNDINGKSDDDCGQSRGAEVLKYVFYLRSSFVDIPGNQIQRQMEELPERLSYGSATVLTSGPQLS